MDSFNEIAKLVAGAGPFALGAIFSAWLACHLFKSGHESMITAFKESESRCRILLEEQRVKDNRIDELHRKLKETEDFYSRQLSKIEDKR